MFTKGEKIHAKRVHREEILTYRGREKMIIFAGENAGKTWLGQDGGKAAKLEISYYIGIKAELEPVLRFLDTVR